MVELLASPFFVGVGVPFILLVLGAVSRKLVRGKPWEKKDFYLGIQFTFAALSSALLYTFDIAKRLSSNAPPKTSEQLIASVTFIVVTFFFLVLLLAIHQDWESRDGESGQFLRLGIISNLTGSGLLFSFVVFIKGV